MKNLISHILTFIISWTLVYSPIAYAQEDANTSSSTETTSASTTDSGEEVDPNDADACTKSGEGLAMANSCRQQGQAYNCHLKRCVIASENDLYNREYNKCKNYATEEETKSCQNDLNGLVTEMDQTQQNAMAAGSADAGSNGMATTGVTVLTAAAVALGCLSAAFGASVGIATSCSVDNAAGAIIIGIVGLAMAFMSMQASQYEDQFEQAVDMMKQSLQQDGGWSKTGQVTAFQSQSQALDMIRQAAEDKASHHKTMVILGGIALVLAILSWTYGWITGGVCSGAMVASSILLIALETSAMNHAKDVASEAADSKAQVDQIIAKLNKYYNFSGGGTSVSSNNVKRAAKMGNTKVESLTVETDQQKTAVDSNEGKKCVDKNNNVVACPCGDACLEFDFSMPNNKTGTQLANLLNTKEMEKAANEAAKGNTAPLKSAATDKNLALSRKVANRAIDTLLKNKGDEMRKKDKDLIKAFRNPGLPESKKVLANRINQSFSPLRAAVMKHRYGGPSAEDLKKLKVAKIDTDQTGADYADAMKKQLEALKKSLETDINLDDLNGVKLDALGNVATEEGAMPTGQGIGIEDTAQTINPERRLNIFKIISNRYNILRINKRFAR
jgi:hypothetical protein